MSPGIVVKQTIKKNPSNQAIKPLARMGAFRPLTFRWRNSVHVLALCKEV